MQAKQRGSHPGSRANPGGRTMIKRTRTNVTLLILCSLLAGLIAASADTGAPESDDQSTRNHECSKNEVPPHRLLQFLCWSPVAGPGRWSEKPK